MIFVFVCVETVTDFLKLLPYLLLVQRSIEASNNNNSSVSEVIDDCTGFDASSSNHLYESQRRQSALHLESLRNQMHNSVREVDKR
jgi:hypothetical protein